MHVRKNVNDRFACGTSESHFRNEVEWIKSMVDSCKRPRQNGGRNDPVPELSPYGGFPERDRAGVDYLGQTSTFISR